MPSGTLVYDNAWSAPRPGVLVTHDWMGNTERTALSAVKLAKLGYVAFCVDVYGKGVRPSSPDEAGTFRQIAVRPRCADRKRF